MKLKETNTELINVLEKIKIQIIDSIPFCKAYLVPQFYLYIKTNNLPNNTKSIFNFLKTLIEYKADPAGIELLQSAETLLTYKNKHGKSGSGDCDCFTILAAAMLITLRFNPENIAFALVGNSNRNPSHIYLYVNNLPFDLTEHEYKSQRNYKYLQLIKYTAIK